QLAPRLHVDRIETGVCEQTQPSVAVAPAAFARSRSPSSGRYDGVAACSVRYSWSVRRLKFTVTRSE
ncbi:MAG: hypothetical protein ABGY41_03650, partial [Candidatus Poribacteria bacterium]